MTAIAGLIHFDGSPVDVATVERMQNVLRPYGRDAQHHWRQGSAAMLRTLLRTTPEDSLDQQPLYHAESDTRVVFDGRLDNREELSRALGLSAAEMALLADSKLALLAILRWNKDAVKHFVGDFALACWRAREKQLWLARDPLGHRPLFWYKQARFFAFASLAKGLFAIPGIPRTLCEERISDRLSLIPFVGPESFFKDIFRVEPGQILILQGENITVERYHRFDPDKEIHLPRDEDYLEAFREKLDQAVASQLRSNGPVASHLSSGFDSSTVTALAAQMLAKRGERLSAYTAVPREGFNEAVSRDRHADERPGAKALAAKFDNIDHFLIPSSGSSPLGMLEAYTEAIDRPLVNPCNQMWINDIQEHAASRNARVILSGAMGNMTISYTGEQYLPALLGKGQLVSWSREFLALKRKQSHRRWRGLLAQSIGPFMPVWLWASLTYLRGYRRNVTDNSAIHPDFAKRIGTAERALKANWDTKYRPWADGRRMRIAVMNRHDNGEFQLGANLHGLDVRDPTADLRLIEFGLSVPDSQYLRNGETRWLLKRMMGHILPTEIMDSPTKGLQAADWYEGVQADLPQLIEELHRLAAHPSVGQYLDLDTLLADLKAWPTTKLNTKAIERKYRLKLLRGLGMAQFIRYVEPDNVQKSQ